MASFSIHGHNCGNYCTDKCHIWEILRKETCKMCSTNCSSSWRVSSKQRRMQLTTPMMTIMLMMMNEDATINNSSLTSSSLKTRTWNPSGPLEQCKKTALLVRDCFPYRGGELNSRLETRAIFFLTTTFNFQSHFWPKVLVREELTGPNILGRS